MSIANTIALVLTLDSAASVSAHVCSGMANVLPEARGQAVIVEGAADRRGVAMLLGALTASPEAAHDLFQLIKNAAKRKVSESF